MKTLVAILCFLGLSLLVYGKSNEEELAKILDSIKQTDEQIQTINNFLDNPNNIWMKKYANFVNYNQVVENITQTQKEIQRIKSLPQTLETQMQQLSNLERNLNTLNSQRELLQEYKDAPFKELLEPAKLEEAPNITNPLLIIQAFSYINHAKASLAQLSKNYADLQNNLEKLKEKSELLKNLLNYFNQPNRAEIEELCEKNACLFKNLREVAQASGSNYFAIGELESTENILNTTLEIYSKNVEEINSHLTEQIKAQILKGVYIGISILVLVGIAFGIKLGVRKYIQDSERIYTTNKIINFLNISVIVLILLFAYMDNVTYLVTVLGFASAGLAIAMKDWFMSIFGWIVIVVGGAVHVGDRIKVIKDGALYVGDVLDISMLRITLYEDVTLASYLDNRRAGRIVFIPNNFVFTTMFSNYTHSGMRTVWDGIDFTITFESDHTKACNIARECVKKYAKGYTDSARKQFSKLRNHYALRTTNVEPRVFSFLEANGIRISVWYLTNAYATLALRSSISAEIIDEILKEPSIKIAYPSTSIYLDKRKPFRENPPEVENL